MKVFNIIVIYNKLIDESRTCRTLKDILQNSTNQYVYIIDNSTIDNVRIKNHAQCREREWKYLTEKENLGISKAYNLAIRSIKEMSNENDVVVLLDDDTQLCIYYYLQLFSLMKDTSIDIAAPYIIDQNGTIISPDNAGRLKNRFIKSKEDAYKLTKFNAINSCSAVRIRVYKEYAYDESLFLDLIDNKFYEDQRNLQRKFGVINCEIQHNIQLNSETDINKIMDRYKIRVKDLKAFCHALKISRITGFFKVLAWSVLEFYRHRNFQLSFRIMLLWFSNVQMKG